MRQTLDQLSDRIFANLVLNYGASKNGKTQSIATLAKLDLLPIWDFNFDGDDGPVPLIRSLKKILGTSIQNDDLVIFSYNAKSGQRIGSGLYTAHTSGKEMALDFFNDFNGLYDYVDTNTGKWKCEKTKDGLRLPKVIAIDSWTGLQEILLDFVLANVGKELGQAGTDSRDFYGKQMGKIKEIVSSAGGLPCLTIFNAHETLNQNDVTSEIRIDPSVTGKLAQTISKNFGVVLYSTTNGTKFIWQTRPRQYIKTAGTRAHEDLPIEVDQDYSKVL